MDKCCVCKKPITNDEPAILFVGKAGDDKEICAVCEQKMDALLERQEPAKIKDAVNYLYTCFLASNDPEVASYLKEVIDTNSPIVAEIENKMKKSEPLDTSAMRDYFAEQSGAENNQQSSFWISGMKSMAWIAFVAVIVCGIIIALQSGGTRGVLIVAASVVLAFLAVAMLMIFLNLSLDISKMTRDTSEIKQMLQERQKK